MVAGWTRGFSVALMAALREPVVVVADDDPGIRTIVSHLLEANGYYVVACGDGEGALQLTDQLKPALLVLDIKMPKLDGLSVCRKLRTKTDVPVIFLTVVDDESEAVSAFEAGGDDYIRKPFGARELVARVGAVLKRFSGEAPARQLELGSLELDSGQRLAYMNAQELTLSATEYAVLHLLMENANRVLTYGQLLERVWGYDYQDSRQVARLVVHRLRRKLEGATDVVLETVAGAGYRLKGPTG